MKGGITQQRLAKDLAKSGKDAWAYLVQGGEELLVQECRMLLRKHCPADEVVLVRPEPGRKAAESLADQLSEYIDYSSLFSETRHIEVLLEPEPSAKIEVSTKIDSNTGKVLVDAARRAESAQARLAICIARADRALLKTSWFDELHAACVHVTVPMVSRSTLPEWIAGRLSDSGRRLTDEAMNLLVDMTEGNLTAASQEVMKIEMLFPEGEIDADKLRGELVDLSRHNVFALRDILSSGKPREVVRSLEGLRREGVPGQLVLWALAAEARALVALAEGRNPQNVWGQHLRTLKDAAAAGNAAGFLQLLSKVQAADFKLRGLTNLAEDPWEDILMAALHINRSIRRRAA